MTTVAFGDAGGIITEAVTDEVRQQLVGQERNLIARTIIEANSNLEEAAAVNEWDVESVTASWDVVVDERGGELAIRIENTHPAADFFEFGTSDHVINGRPVLSFVWEERHDPPEWIREHFDEATSEGGRPGYRVFLPRVEVQGLPETRFLRAALDFLENQMRGRGLTS
jgi:hypothetical protein